MTLPLSASVFAIVQPLIEERFGLHHDLGDKDLLAAKLSIRAREAGFESLLDYYYYLRYDDAGPRELDVLADHLVVNETYFFRELGPLELLADRLAARVRTGERVRVWSAACSTGEEPLTLAMLLAARGVLDDVDIVASDLSARALDAARSGRFGRRAVRTPVPAFARPYLDLLAGAADGHARVAPALIARIDWRRLNLMDRAAVATLGSFDAIVCRNVLIYFSDETVRRVVETLLGALKPDGALFVGISESLLRFGTATACEEESGVFFYRRVKS